MKRLLSILSAIILLAGCDRSNEVELLIGDPSQRISDTVNYVRSTLIEASNGWIAYTTTDRSGGYGFYFEFGDDDRLSMVADVTNEAATEIKESTYRVRQIMSATLVFDTYNYITMLQDPDPGTLGGAAGVGLGSDVEYEYIRTSGDTMVFRGRRFEKDLVLVRATAEQQQAYLEGIYAQAISKYQQFFVDNPNPYVDFDGIRYAISTNHTTKALSLTAVVDGEVRQSSESFYYTLDGAAPIPLLINGALEIINVAFDEDDLYVYTSDGNRYQINNSISPILPLHLLMGVNYTGLYSAYRTIYPGTNSAGASILNYFHNNITNISMVGFSFDDGYLYFVWNTVNQRIELRGASYQRWNNNDNPFITTYVYSYTADGEGEYSLTPISGPTGGYVSSIMSQVHTFLLNSRFRLDYHVDGSNFYGKMTGVDLPDVEMTFELR